MTTQLPFASHRNRHAPGGVDELSPYYVPLSDQGHDAPGLGMFFPTAHGAAGDRATNDTTAVQDALTAAGDAVAAGLVGVDNHRAVGVKARVLCHPALGYAASELFVPSNVELCGGGTLIHAANATTHLLQLADGSVSGVTLRDLNIDGNSENQTNAVDAIHFDNTGGDTSLDPGHRILFCDIAYVKNDGLSLKFNTRRTVAFGLNIYYCDRYGAYLAGGDSQLSHIDVGQSGQTGVVFAAGAAPYLASHIKSWYSGRLDNLGNGFLIESDEHTLSNAYSQDNMGHGYLIFRSGHVIANPVLENCISDRDNAANGGFFGFDLFNVTNAMIRGHVRAGTAGGRGGAPVSAVQCAGGTTGCDIRLGSVGTTSFEVASSADNIHNHIEVNGRDGAGVSVVPGATYNFNPLVARTHFLAPTGNLTIANPSRKPGGMEITFVITNNAAGGHTISFGTDFKVNWTPDLTANKTNSITFRSDGTFWWQIATSVGM